MFRCVLPKRLRAAAVLAVLAVLCAAALPAAAQQPMPPRLFPATALRGELTITQPPAALLNGRPAQLAPGTRIRDEANLIQLSGTLAGRKLLVHYTTDLYGQLLDVWVLRPQEAANKPWPATREQAASWLFNADTQTWARP